jgi:hypothetical protein
MQGDKRSRERLANVDNSCTVQPAAWYPWGAKIHSIRSNSSYLQIDLILLAREKLESTCVSRDLEKVASIKTAATISVQS